MSSLKNEDLLSDVEPLPDSAASPPRSASASPFTPSRSNWPLPSSSHCPASLAHSWPSSPLPARASSSQVTARLYASLHRSRELEFKGLSESGSPFENFDRPRQVTFNLSSPDLRIDERVTPVHPAPLPSSFSKQLEECKEAGSASPASPPASLSPSPGDPAVGRPLEGEEGGRGLELGQLAEEMSFNLQTRVENTCATALNGRRHILDMENVRSHLQTMLRATKDPTESERTAVLSGYSLPERLRLDNESFESDSTAHLIGALGLADVSPPSSLSGLEELFPRYSRLRPDSALPSAETQVLRDSLEMERTRRKHLEKQIQVLQNKALQLQQQLALAVSADRKKDVMIEQLDKTLAKVVEGWRRQEEEKSVRVRSLQEQKEAAERAQAKQQEVLARFEQSLSQAAETLDSEQKRAEELRAAKRQTEQQLAELRGQQQEQTRQREEARAEVERLQLQAKEAQASLTQHKEAWAGRERELQEQAALQEAQLDRDKSNREREAQLRQDVQRELQEAQGRLQQLERELEEVRRERDAVRMDRALDQARFESQCSQLDVEYKLSVEQQVTERLASLQETNAKTTASLRERHRKQLLDLSARHERELSAQLAQFRTELQEREERQRKQVEEFEERMSAKQEEVVLLEASRRKLEAQRTELVTRLQQLMRSHWTEALRLLALQGQMDEATTSPCALLEKAVSQPAYGGIIGSRSWELPLRLSRESASVSPESRPASDVPQAFGLQLSRERGEAGGDASSQDSSPRGPLAQLQAPEHDVSVLLNHSHTFRSLEPLLDDTALGSCEMEELSARAPRGGEERGYAAERGYAPERGQQPERHGRERGYSSDGGRAERGHSSGGEENCGYAVRGGDAGQSGYSSSAEREGPCGYGSGGDRDQDRGHRAGVGGHGTARERDGRRGTGGGVSVPLTRSAGQRADEASAGRERGFPVGHKEYRERRERLAASGHSWEAGGPITTQSFNVSATESIRDSSYCSTIVSQAPSGNSRGFEGSVVGKPITTPQGPRRPGDVQGDLGTARWPLGHTSQAESPGTNEEDRQSELQYYITKLLDRSPGDPVEPSALADERPPAGQSSSKTGLSSSWNSEQTKAPAGMSTSSLYPASSAAAKAKLHPAALSPQMLGQLSYLLSQYHPQPDRAAPSLDELLACVLSGQANRSLQGANESCGDGPVHRNVEPKLSQASKKEQAAVPPPDRRSLPPKPAGGDRTQTQPSRAKRAGPQTQRGGPGRANVWR